MCDGAWIFVSHSPRALEQVREIRNELERRGWEFGVDAVCLEFRIHAAGGGGVLICGFNRLKPDSKRPDRLKAKINCPSLY